MAQTNPICETTPKMRPLFPLKAGSTVGMFTIDDYGTMHRNAELKLVDTLRDRGIEVLQGRVPICFGDEQRKVFRLFLDKSIDTGISTLFMTGGIYSGCVLAASQEAALYALYVKAKPVSLIYPEEAIFRSESLSSCRTAYRKFLGMVPFYSEYHVDYGAAEKFCDDGRQSAPALSLGVFSRTEILEHRSLDQYRTRINPTLYIADSVPDLLNDSNVPLAQRSGFIRDLVLYAAEKTGRIISTLGFVSLVLGLANEGLIKDKEQAEFVEKSLLDVLNIPTILTEYREVNSIATISKARRPDFEECYGPIKDFDGLSDYLDWLREYA